MAKTRFERLETTGPDTAAFRISGKLGFHENVKVEHLVEECTRREFSRVVFDFTELSSLGGGVAKILRRFISDQEAGGREVRFVITNDVVLDFLRDDNTEIKVYSSMEEAFRPGPGSEGAAEYQGPVATIDPARSDSPGDDAAGGSVREESGIGASSDDPEVDTGVILMSYDGDEAPDRRDQNADTGPADAGISGEEVAEETPETDEGDGNKSGERIISAIFNEGEKKDLPSGGSAVSPGTSAKRTEETAPAVDTD
ncbi:MAG TPA: STAS domain-containing protein, partial [Candidatus Krumholzibacterium sp.]|nr:STAS domain-containing protein [Candidatus Krumholzibacterium sp.]